MTAYTVTAEMEGNAEVVTKRHVQDAIDWVMERSRDPQYWEFNIRSDRGHVGTFYCDLRKWSWA